MNIGFVSVWAERGAGYVTRAYLECLESNNNVFVYARAGEVTNPTDGWDQEYVTWGKILPNTRISWKHFRKWICKNNIEVLFFNEQRDFQIIYMCKLYVPNVKLGTYVDYYKMDMISKFKYYDFLICNTRRHQSVFEWHEQAYYIPWGTNIDLYKPLKENGELVEDGIITFFHSAGMATRKGTDILLDVFVNSDLCNKSKLVLHTQISISNFTKLSIEELSKKNVTVIEKTVEAPGLYYMGDIYVYPTTLDGLGLTMYEALSSGLPVITSDNAPMNEIIDGNVGELISIDKYLTREDGYYWPLCYVDKHSLYNKMKNYVENPYKVKEQKLMARKRALENLDFSERSKEISRVFYETKILAVSEAELKSAYAIDRKKNRTNARIGLEMIMPAWIVDCTNKFAKMLKKKK